MAYAHVAHDCSVGNHVILANSANMGGHCVIEDHAVVGGLVAIHQFSHIGRHSMIGGGFRVTKDVPPYVLAGSEPLAFTGQHERIVPLRVWFRWMARHHHILHNPASELELPRLGLPKAVLTSNEAEQILIQPNIDDPLGMRDRAILEMLYSTGMRLNEDLLGFV